jgi:hypothetical protein
VEKNKQQNNHGYSNEDGDNFIEDANKLPGKYYWKTPDGWLYLYDKDKPEIEVSKNFVVYIAEVDSQVKNKYNEIYGSKLVVPDEKKLIL